MCYTLCYVAVQGRSAGAAPGDGAAGGDGGDGGGGAGRPPPEGIVGQAGSRAGTTPARAAILTRSAKQEVDIR